MEIVIKELSDLLTVAAILVKNGYTVRKSKRRKVEGKNVFDQVLIVEMEVSKNA